MIRDCKQWEAALTPEGRNHQTKQAVHGQIRTSAEGLEADFIKANKKKHRKSVGGLCECWLAFPIRAWLFGNITKGGMDLLPLRYTRGLSFEHCKRSVE